MSEHGGKANGGEKEEPKIHCDLFDELFPGRFLKAPLLRGQKPTVRITEVYRQRLRGKTTPQTVIAFDRSTPGPCELVLPKINGTALRGMFGEPTNWVGKRVTFFATAEWLPKTKGVACVRVWGSPDIEREIVVTFAPAGKPPIEMTMHVTGKGKSATPSARNRPDEADRDSPPPEGEDELGGRQ